MKIMKRYIVNLVLYSIVSLWIFSSCEDYDFKDIPDPVIPEDLTPGLKLSQKEIMIDVSDALNRLANSSCVPLVAGGVLSRSRKPIGFLIMNRNPGTRVMLLSGLL